MNTKNEFNTLETLNPDVLNLICSSISAQDFFNMKMVSQRVKKLINIGKLNTNITSIMASKPKFYERLAANINTKEHSWLLFILTSTCSTYAQVNYFLKENLYNLTYNLEELMPIMFFCVMNVILTFIYGCIIGLALGKNKNDEAFGPFTHILEYGSLVALGMTFCFSLNKLDDIFNNIVPLLSSLILPAVIGISQNKFSFFCQNKQKEFSNKIFDLFEKNTNKDPSESDDPVNLLK
jgi:hypothetical protein